MNRRRFVSMIAGIGVTPSTLLFRAIPPVDSLLSRKRVLMGTVFEVLSYSAEQDRASRVMDLALAEVERLDTMFSSFKPNSELSRLNQAGCSTPCRLSPDLYRILEMSQEFARLSGGRFDVTVGKLTRLWRQSQEEGRRPTEKDLREAHRSVGYRNLILTPPDRLLTRPGVGEIDLGGIGKGFAVDRAAQILRDGGLNRSLINAGRSSLLALDPPPHQDGWRIQIQSTDQELALTNRAMSTSSQPAVPTISEEEMFGHIFDPLTGQPAEFGTSVTIICGSGAAADALSTACLLLGYEQSCKMLESFNDVSMIWTAADGASRTFTRNQ
ncbi:MAG TPA: FAD:protein FMN transferase [Acidobacteriota bacterium]|nr:FAD:protein FMN transferase [Acidobacteriota bacterium]